MRVAGKAKLVGTWRIPGVIPPGVVGGTSQSVELVRPFSWVAGLAIGERILLVLPSRLAIAEVFLNGNQIERPPGGLEQSKFDLTDFIRPRNELVLRLKIEAREEWKESELPTLRVETQRGAEE